MNVSCTDHGDMPCQYIICSACGAIYKLTSNPPERCPCGVRLMPNNDAGGEFSARLICTPCAEGLLAQRRTRSGKLVGGS